MESMIAKIQCSECGLAWDIDWLQLAVARPLRCPFCANQHFGFPREPKQSASAHAKPPTAAKGAPRGRKSIRDKNRFVNDPVI